MSVFDDIFAAHAVPVLQEQMGVAVTLYADSGDSLTVTAVSLGEAEGNEQADDLGRGARRSRLFAVSCSDVIEPKRWSKVKIGADLWALPWPPETETEALITWRATREPLMEEARATYRGAP